MRLDRVGASAASAGFWFNLLAMATKAYSASRNPARMGRPADALVRRSFRRALWHDGALRQAIVDALWEDPDRLLAASTNTVLKAGDRCTVMRLPAAPGQPALEAHAMVLKRYNLKGGGHTAVHLLLRSRARWSWLNARRLIRAGVPTPRPLACVEERSVAVFRLRSYLLTEFVVGSSLHDLVERRKTDHGDLAQLAKQFATIWQVLGQLRIGHGDMKATNFMVDESHKLWLIDLDGMRTYRSGLVLRRERRNDLTRFMRNWQQQPEVAAIFRARIGTG